MSDPTTFPRFRDLPPELQRMIFQFYRRGRIRHYFFNSLDPYSMDPYSMEPYSMDPYSEQPDSFFQHYAAIDLATDRFAETVLTREYLERLGTSSAGRRNDTISLSHEYYYGKPGEAAESPQAHKVPEGWLRANGPLIAVDYTADIFTFQGLKRSTWGRTFNLPYMGFADTWLPSVHTWLPNVECLAVTLPITDDEDVICAGFTQMEKLKHVYIVTYRDPYCRYGAPSRWENFKRELLNKGGFLEFMDWAVRHPMGARKECLCGTEHLPVIDADRTLKAAYFRAHKSQIETSIVADPY
ncbi:hypothetical protein GGR51DRAFT_505462 [Nemania sp. FL0031]|nr:hypothetical protein GGR51DRAFT_505462 [Nemania sp. FL0031]